MQLESDGLVNFHPHRGARVRTLSPAQINEIYRLRTLLESYALRFYREMYDAENNPLLVEMIEELRGHEGRYLLGFRFDRHLDLVDHIAASDLTGAKAWLYVHLEGVRAGIQALATDEDVLGATGPGDCSGMLETAGLDEVAALASVAAVPKLDMPPRTRRAAASLAPKAATTAKAGRVEARPATAAVRRQ